MDDKQIGRNIKYFRKLHNWTQQELGEKLNTSRSAIAKWENGVVIPDINSIMALCKVFSASVEHLIGSPSILDALSANDPPFTYQITKENVSATTMETMAFVLTNNKLKQQLHQLSKLPPKKQKGALKILEQTLEEIEKL